MNSCKLVKFVPFQLKILMSEVRYQMSWSNLVTSFS